MLCGKYYFNSRPHGGRHAEGDNKKAIEEFQLTPSRRATCFCHVLYLHFLFQLTPSRRATGRSQPVSADGRTFQLTPSRRATKEIADELSISAFQLTPSRRATVRARRTVASGLLFQLTPSRRATSRSCVSPALPGTFQLTPSRRATCGGCVVLNCRYYFNSRPHGGRPPTNVKRTDNWYFNSRPHGGRPLWAAVSLPCTPFQLTPSRRAT